MTESSYYGRLGRYYLEETDYEAVEVKFTRTNRIPFTCLAPHQEEALLNQWHYKIPDTGIGRKPLDLVFKRRECPIVIIYYTPRAAEIYEIPIRAWIKERYESREKSLTKERAATIGSRVSL